MFVRTKKIPVRAARAVAAMTDYNVLRYKRSCHDAEAAPAVVIEVYDQIHTGRSCYVVL